MPEDAGAARALVSAHFRDTRYEARLLEQLESTLQFEDPEYVALLAAPPDGARLHGLAMFGEVAGARAVIKLHALVGADAGVLAALLDALQSAAERSGERMIVCELPDDAPFERAALRLDAAGFVEEGRVRDFVRDGVALRLLVWRP